MPGETTRFDVQDHLRGPEEQVAYAEAVMEDGDAHLIATALGDIARARSVTQLAGETGLSGEPKADEATVFLLFEEVSDQYGTSEIAGVFTSEANAKAAQDRIRDRRSWVSPWPLDELRRPRR